MDQNNFEFEQKSIKRYVAISMIAHVGLFLALTIKATFFTEPPIQFEEAIRVDMVGLPDKVIEQPPAPPAPTVAEAPPAPEPEPEPAKPEPPPPEPAPKKEEPKPIVKAEPPKPKELPKTKVPDAVSLEKAKTKQKQALEKLKQMEALEAIQKDIENENKKKAAAAAQAASQVKYKGNVISPGTSLTGVQKLQSDSYQSDVHKHMISNWAIPEYLKNRGLRTDVLIRIDENGYVISKEVIKASGNPTFDELVLSAIQKSSPVPRPPDKFVKLFSVQGILFRFSHED